MNELKVGKKTNHKKGIAAAAKARRREEGEARNAKYQTLSWEEKMKTAGSKVIMKLQKEKR